MPLSAELGRDIVWIDLLRPTDEEERAVEAALQIDIPVREELAEIEASSRLYARGGATFMTATLVTRGLSGKPEAEAVTFILVGQRLVTMRYCEPMAFDLFAREAADPHGACATSGTGILIDLLEAIVDRIADHLERVAAIINTTSRELFEPPQSARRTRDYRLLLRRIGEEGDFTSNIRDSLVSLGRLVAFFAATIEPATGKAAPDRSRRALLKTLQRDVLSLTDHASFLSNKITFLLEATIGMVGIQQNEIIKVFSVAAVALLPLTLIASIYGMNFQYMPELDWRIGYPFAIGLMILSAVLPFLYFRRKGWI
jgi:magnesium transporter